MNLQEKLLTSLKAADPDDKRELIRLIEEKATRDKENLAKKYVPNVKCEEFIKIVGSNDIFISLLSAANGVGKTCVGSNMVANICFGPQNKYFEYPLYQEFPYLKRGRIISDPTTLKEKIVPELKQWFPSNRYEIKYETYKEGKSYESRWVTDTGYVIDLMSTEQQPKEFESVDLGFVWIDEPCPQSIFHATIARLRRGGLIFMTLTPLKYSAWIKDDIYDKRDGTNIEYVTANVWDNCSDIPGTRGILKKHDIERMIAQYPEDEKAARIEGEFGHLLGRVHKSFDRKIHVIKPFRIDNKEYVVVKAHDTHPREPDHILWMAIDRKGTKYIIHELITAGSLAETAAQIKLIEETNKFRMIDHLIDPSAFVQDRRTSILSVGDQFYEHGIEYRPGSKDLVGGIRRTDEALTYEEKGGELIRAPEVFFFDTVPVMIKQLENYVWDEYRGTTADDRQAKPKPKDKDDHNVENLHRLIIEEFQWQEKKQVTMESVYPERYKKKPAMRPKSSTFKQVPY